MKIGIVIQRFGRNISGGAELHGRLVAEHLRAHHHVEILTTCARDYLSWENEFEPGRTEEDGLIIHRFPVRRTKDLERFHHLSYLVSHCPHRRQDEIDWLNEHGPDCPDLVRFLEENCSRFDAVIFFSYRYATIYYGLTVMPEKSILVPTAENDRIIYLSIFREFFQKPAAIAYNSIEEREMIIAVTGNDHIPGLVVGVGLSEVEPAAAEKLFRLFDIRRPYILYVGRMEGVKGCARLVDYYLRSIHGGTADLDLVFVGRGDYHPPDHPTILHLSDVSETEKMALIKASRCLVMPSPYESLSMVLLEAMKMKVPFLANGDCPVLRGQSLRSGGGLYYRNYDEFEEGLQLLLTRPELAQRLGEQGFDYYARHYTWPIIMSKYDELFQRVTGR